MAVPFFENNCTALPGYVARSVSLRTRDVVYSACRGSRSYLAPGERSFGKRNIVSRCFKPSQPRRNISGLKKTFIKRDTYIYIYIYIYIYS